MRVTTVLRRGRAADLSAGSRRLVILLMFFLFGLGSASFTSRLTSIKESLGVSAGTFGTIMLASAIGSLVLVLSAGAVITKIGGLAASYISVGLFSSAYLIMSAALWAHSLSLFIVGMFFWGSYAPLINVPINVEGVGVERALGRSIMPQFHATFSLGTVAGVFSGAWVSGLGVPVPVHFLAAAVLIALTRLWAIPRMIVDSEIAHSAARAKRAAARTDRATASSAGSQAVPVRAITRSQEANRVSGLRALFASSGALAAWREVRTLLIGLIVFSGSLSEGSAGTWMALGISAGFRVSESRADIVYGIFLVTMTLTRIVGTKAVDRFGRVISLRVSGVFALIGLLVYALSGSLVLAAIGAAVWGIGAALNSPLAYAAAGDDPLKAAVRLSVVTSFGSTASLVAPPMLGLLANAFGVRHALLVIAVVMLAALTVMQAARPPRE